jgi:hypothetical protein
VCSRIFQTPFFQIDGCVRVCARTRRFISVLMPLRVRTCKFMYTRPCVCAGLCNITVAEFNSGLIPAVNHQPCFHRGTRADVHNHNLIHLISSLHIPGRKFKFGSIIFELLDSLALIFENVSVVRIVYPQHPPGIFA